MTTDRTQMLSIAAAALVPAMFVACAPFNVEEAPTTGVTVRAGRGINGRGINGRGINGRGINGRGINGRGINGRGINGRGINGRGINGVFLNLSGSELTLLDKGGNVISFADLGGGGEFTAALDDGTELLIYIEDSGSLDALENADVRLYTVWYYDGGGDVVQGDGTTITVTPGWVALADDADGNPVATIPLAHRWNLEEGVEGGGAKIYDPDVITLAVRGFALAKCVELGYKPWASDASGYSFDSTHQACVRMIRADYCGDGRSWTRDGTPINVYDDIVVQEYDQDPLPAGEQWWHEGEWDADGARCVTAQRIRDWNENNADAPVPVCLVDGVWVDFEEARMSDPECGTHWPARQGTELQNDFIDLAGTPSVLLANYTPLDPFPNGSLGGDPLSIFIP